MNRRTFFQVTSALLLGGAITAIPSQEESALAAQEQAIARSIEKQQPFNLAVSVHTATLDAAVVAEIVRSELMAALESM